MTMRRFSSARRPRKSLAEINVVPYIDVMLVLLVIFMVTAPLLTQGVQVNLPQAQAKSIDSKDQIPIVVTVDRSGNYYLNLSNAPNQPISAAQLETDVSSALQLAKQQQRSRDVYVKGDTTASYGQVVQAMTLLQKAGAENVGLITEPNAS